MGEVLDKIGEDMADHVLDNKLPLGDLDVLVSDEITLFEMMMLSLGRIHGFRSFLLVGDDPDMLRSYVNALSVLMSQPTSFRQRLLSISITNDQVIRNLVSKRLWWVEVERFRLLESNEERWNETVKLLIDETRNEGYYLYFDELHKLFPESDEVRPHSIYPFNQVFWAVRGTSLSLTLVSTLSWKNYITRVERYGGFLRACSVVKLSPRPDYSPSNSN